MKPTKNQMPINQESLTSMSFFVNYCRDNGVKINEEILEQLHKEGLVFPALKLYLGMSKFNKVYMSIDGKEDWRYVYNSDLHKHKVIKTDSATYYGVSGLIMSGPGWLDYYLKNKMTEMPSQINFKSWKQKRYPGYYTDSKLIEDQYQFLYDRKQILAIKIALRYLKLIKNCEPDYKKELIKAAQKRLSDLYKFLEVYHGMECLRDRFLETAEKWRSDLKKLNGQNPSKLDWDTECDFIFTRQFKAEAENILKKHNATIQFINDWRIFLSGTSLINESGRSNKIRINYIKALGDEDIVNLEDCHYMIYIVNSFFYFLTGEDKTVKQVLGDFNYQICTVCGNGFKARNKEQITCGSSSCVRANKNKLKAKKRKIANLSKK